jgi:hypothetical protein
MTRFISYNLARSLAVVAPLLVVGTARLAACPFCTVESQTLTEEINSSDAVVLARLVADAPPIDVETDGESGIGESDPDAGKATFRVVDVLRGEDRVAENQVIKVVYFGEGERDATFLVSGVGVEEGALEWTTPLPLSATAIQYVRKLPGVPESGVERLAFFQDYLENDDPLLAQDAYDEFARAPYSEVHELQGHMIHDRLVQWIKSPDVNPSRRRLYLTMLGVCGDERDLPMLEEMISSDFTRKKPLLAHMVACGLALGGPISLPVWIEVVDLDERQKKLGLDAAIACYLTLRGADGLELIDERFLKNPKVEYTHAYMTIMALRFHGEEGNVVPRERLLESMRLLLDSQDFADQVIPDLARWEDWSVLERLVAMYKTGDENNFVRQPTVTYLSVASEQPGDVGRRATAALADLEAFDPEGVKRAKSMMAFGFLARARKTEPATGGTRPDANAAVAAVGFEASSAEAATENDDASAIPDPTSFDDAKSIDQATVADEPAPNDESESDDPKDEAAAVEPPPIPDVYARPIVIGAPLASALVLMALYWLILRWGAV